MSYGIRKSYRAGQLVTVLSLLFILLSGSVYVQAQATGRAGRKGRTDKAKAFVTMHPSSGSAGATLQVEAWGLYGVSGVNLTFEPSGLQATNVRAIDRGISFRLKIAAGARPGPYTMIVRTPDQYPKRYPAAFTVIAGPSSSRSARILRVVPAKVSPGKNYTLNLTGEGFTSGMQVSFGRDIQPLTPVMVKDAARASVNVRILSTATAGARLATVLVPGKADVKGPGGVFVGMFVSKIEERPEVGVKPVQVDIIPPSGKITPLKPNIQGYGDLQQVKMWDDPPMIQKDSVFTWIEDNPGIAEYFVFTIKDKSGKTIIEAQLPADKPYYRVSTAMLKNLPDGSTVAPFHWELNAGAMSVVDTGKSFRGGQPSMRGSSSAGGSSNSSHVGNIVPTQQEVESLINSMSMSSDTTDYGMIVGMIGMSVTEKAQATWQVKGFWKHPVTKEIQEVEKSPTLPLRLPDKPKGMLNCSAADQPGVLRAENMSQSETAILTAPVTVSLQGTIDLSKDPYPVSVTYSSIQTMTLEYTNVYLSWGDGTVEPLRVDGGPNWNSDEITLVLNGDAKNKGIMHNYAEPGNYSIKIYSLPTPDEQEPVLPAISTGGEGLYAAAVNIIGGSQSPGRGHSSSEGSVTGASPVTFSATGLSLEQGVEFSSTGQAQSTAANLQVLGSDAYLIACHEIHVDAPPDLTAEGPLHLLKVEVTRFPGYDGIPAKVSDCAEAFTAEAELTYYGSKGHIVWVWTVDGEQIMGSIADLPPAGKDSPGTYTLSSPSLPVPLTDKPHGVCVRVKAMSEMGELSQIFGPDSGGMSCAGSMYQGQSSTSDSVTRTVMRPSAMSFSDTGKVISNTSHGNVSLSSGSPSPGNFSVSFKNNYAANLSSSLPLVVKVQLNQSDRDVWSKQVAYEVVPHDPNIPCRLYFQAKGGPFTISDVQSMVEEHDGTYSGKGMLHLATPMGPGGYSPFFVPIAFSHLALEGAGDGRKVTAGTIDADPYDPATLAGEVTGLSGRVSHVKATAGAGNDFLVTFDLKISDMARLEPKVGNLGLTVTGAITADGNFYAEKKTPGGGNIPLQASFIGNSGFELNGQEMILDWSLTEGEAPSGGSCDGISGGGPAWVGLYFKDGTLKPNAMGNPSLGSPISISGWSVGWNGLSGSIPDTKISQGGSIESGGLQLHVKDIAVDVCGSSLDARYGVLLKDVPLIEADVPGVLHIDMDGKLASDFTAPGVTRDFGSIVMELKGADFNNEAGQGFRVALDTLFTFKVKGHTITQVDIDGIRVKGNGNPFEGEAFWKDGSSGTTIALGGSSKVGPLNVDLAKLDLQLGSHNNRPSVNFGLDAKFKISEVLAPSSNTLLYTLQANSPMASPEPTMDSFRLEAAYPSVNPVATMKAKVTWSEDGQGNSKFLGQGTLNLLNTGDISADFLLGYKNGKDYWLCRVSKGLGPQGVPLLPPFLTLYELHGGLGHNIPLNSFASMGDLGSLAPTMDGSYIFNAGGRVGDSGGGWVYTFQGDISVKATGPDAGFRLDVKAWLLTSNHSGNGQFQGVIQYAGGAFDASLSGGYSALNGTVSVTAPNGAVNLHFGNGTWHVYMGQNQPGLMVTAHVLISDCSGYLMLDDNGLIVGGVIGDHYHLGGSWYGFGGHVDFDYSVEPSVTITPDETWGVHLHGEFSESVSINAGLNTPIGCLCVNPSVTIKFTADAMPLSVCGGAHIRFGRICWCWKGCCKTYGIDVNVCL